MINKKKSSIFKKVEVVFHFQKYCGCLPYFI
jgi:hypothetical protein